MTCGTRVFFMEATDMAGFQARVQFQAQWAGPTESIKGVRVSPVKVRNSVNSSCE